MGVAVIHCLLLLKHAIPNGFSKESAGPVALTCTGTRRALPQRPLRGSLYCSPDFLATAGPSPWGRNSNAWRDGRQCWTPTFGHQAAKCGKATRGALRILSSAPSAGFLHECICGRPGHCPRVLRQMQASNAPDELRRVSVAPTSRAIREDDADSSAREDMPCRGCGTPTGARQPYLNPSAADATVCLNAHRRRGAARLRAYDCNSCCPWHQTTEHAQEAERPCCSLRRRLQDSRRYAWGLQLGARRPTSLRRWLAARTGLARGVEMHKLCFDVGRAWL